MAADAPFRSHLRVLGWLLAEELAAGADEDWVVARAAGPNEQEWIEAVPSRGRARPAKEQWGSSTAAVTRKRRVEAGDLLVASKHGLASVADRKTERRTSCPCARPSPPVAPGGSDHGCSHVAEACRDRMLELLTEPLRNWPPAPTRMARWRSGSPRPGPPRWSGASCGWTPRLPPRGWRASCRYDAHKCDHVCSTAVVAIVEERWVVVAIVEERWVVVAQYGNSRAVLCRGADDAAPIALSSDHKPNKPEEQEQTEAAGWRSSSCRARACLASWPCPAPLGIGTSSRTWSLISGGRTISSLLLKWWLRATPGERDKDKKSYPRPRRRAGPVQRRPWQMNARRSHRPASTTLIHRANTPMI
ncbi:hypothetical protein PVAP13_2NG073092 [Panicum virgatum]|uniref:protein-serine/threonine phosphatase n=1 Tax=Panicum virgatum TaxID=38727 RepID=A0A8T0VFC3_PANVG|nr:hypothetical protein PVAP13_2NG073092 [Panicum virgatum]